MKIGLVVYSDCLPAGLLAFSDMLTAANLRSGRRTFSFSWLSEYGGEVATRNGLTVATQAINAAKVDAVLVPGAWRDTNTALNKGDLDLVTALKRLPDTTQLWSYCTGVCLIAQTGRLDGVSATTTWWLRELVGQQFPRVDWKPHETLVKASYCITASGVNGYLPLALELIQAECGAAMVEGIRRHMMLPRPQGRQTPLQDVPELVQRSNWLRRLIQQIESTPAADLAISPLASAMNTSARTLQRRVVQESDYRCGQLMRLVKINQVGEQLISTSKPLATIGHALGFTDEASLRRSFRQVSGVTPGAYRKG